MLMVLTGIMLSTSRFALADPKSGGEQKNMLYLPLIMRPPATPLIPPPLQPSDCDGEYQFLTQQSYPNGTHILAVGKERLFSPALIVNLNKKILDGENKIITSGSGSRVCLNQSTVSLIYRNPSQPYVTGDEVGITVDRKHRVDWQILDQNPFLQSDGSLPVGKFFTGIVPSSLDEVAQVSKIGQSANLPKAGIFEATSLTRLGRLVNFLNGAMTAYLFIERFWELQDLALDDVSLLHLPDGSSYLPQTRVKIGDKLYLCRYATNFEYQSQTFSIDQIVGLLFQNDVESTNRGWVLTRTAQPGCNLPTLTMDEFLLLAPTLAERIPFTVADDSLDEQLRQILDEIDNIHQDPPAPPDQGGGDGTCRPIDDSVLKMAESYHLGIYGKVTDLPASSYSAGRAWLRSVLQGSEIYTDYYEVLPTPGTQMRRGQLYVSTQNSNEGEFLIETRCIALPSGLVHRFSAYGGCNMSGGISSRTYCPAYFIILPHRGTGIFPFPQ
jgi:hypothetical protein